MRLVFLRRSAQLLLWLLTALMPAWASAEESAAQQVASSLAAMNKSVGSGAHGDGWRRFLRSNDLAAEVAKGDNADLAVVAAILARYKSGAPGTEWPRVVAVRKALENWLQQLPRPSVEELQAMIEQARNEFAAVSDADAEQAKAEVLARAEQLSRFLASGGADTAEGWKRYLQWSALMDELRRDEVPDIGAHAQALEEIANKFQSDQAGLERPQFIAVREALHDYINAAIFASQPDRLEEAFGGRLDQLGALLTEFSKNPADETSVQIGNVLGFIERARQADAMVNAVRRTYGRPNLYAEVSRPLMAAGLENKVDEKLPVRENILGTSIRGTAHTTGDITLDLAPNHDAAQMNFRFRGVADSDNIGHNRSVTIYTRGRTTIDGNLPVYLDETGLHAGDPSAKCKTNTKITNICAPSRLVTNIAWKRAGQSKGQAERIASGRAEGRAEGRMSEQATELLAEPQASYLEKFRNPLLRRGMFPEELQFSTANNRLHVSMQHAGPNRLAAPIAAPDNVDDSDMCVRVHESWVGNFSEAYLAGRTLTDEELVRILQDDLKREVPDEFKITDDKPPWSITFANTRPVGATFDGQEFTIAIRGSRFTRGDQVFDDTIEISARYTIELTDTGSKLTRVGDISVLYEKEKGEKPQPLSVAETGFKGALRNKFSGVFKPEFVGEGFELPGRWKEAGRMELREMKTDKGWLTIAWSLATGGAKTAAAPATQQSPAAAAELAAAGALP